MSQPQLPDGEYRARAVDAQIGQSRNGVDKIDIEFEIQEPAFKGKRIFYHGYFTDKTFQRTEESMKFCGWAGWEDQLTSLIKNEVILVIGAETYEGKTTSRVRFVNSLTGSRLRSPMGEAENRSFVARRKAQAMGGSVPNGQTQAPPISEDPVPF